MGSTVSKIAALAVFALSSSSSSARPISEIPRPICSGESSSFSHLCERTARGAEYTEIVNRVNADVFLGNDEIQDAVEEFGDADKWCTSKNRFGCACSEK